MVTSIQYLIKTNQKTSMCGTSPSPRNHPLMEVEEGNILTFPIALFFFPAVFPKLRLPQMSKHSDLHNIYVYNRKF